MNLSNVISALLIFAIIRVIPKIVSSIQRLKQLQEENRQLLEALDEMNIYIKESEQ